jgi:hypothetical protein
MYVFIITILLIMSIISIILLYPQLLRSPKDAAVVGSVLLLAYVIAMFEAGGHLHVTVDDMFSAVFSLLSPSRYFRR